MLAAQFGAKLLAEVEEVTLDQILTVLRHENDAARPSWTGVTAVDRLLNTFLVPAHSTDALAAEREESPREVEHDEPLISEYSAAAANLQKPKPKPKPKPALIELSSSKPTVGKLNLLYHLTAVSLLANDYGGKEACVVWLDTDVSFSAKMLFNACCGCLATSSTLNHVEIAKEARQALQHLHLITCSSSEQLIESLDNLPDYLLQSQLGGIGAPSGTEQHSDELLPSHYSSHRPVGLVILHSATAFYWHDRFDAEMNRLSGTDTANNKFGTAAGSKSFQVLVRLKGLASRFDCTIVYTTNHSVTPSNHFQPQPTYATAESDLTSQPTQHLPPSDTTVSQFTATATLSLTLDPVTVTQFAPSMSLDECLRDRQKRADVVSKARVRVSVTPQWLDRVVKRDAEGMRIREKLANLGSGTGGTRGSFVVYRAGDGDAAAVVVE